MKVRVSERAQREFDRADSWWRTNRDSTDLLTSEMLAVLDRLRDNPDLGMAYEAARFASPVRRVLLPKTEHHVYHSRVGDEIVILAIWGARQRRGPQL
ncbi:MAG: type II toxin-antitoxin system RelE/ParE family toxin [Deltaproteobacteria bacterium]|nr:type II toxin-antitoxin system RelE/ParE family toxin [Deltaproteobacteria bacterium]